MARLRKLVEFRGGPLDGQWQMVHLLPGEREVPELVHYHVPAAASFGADAAAVTALTPIPVTYRRRWFGHADATRPPGRRDDDQRPVYVHEPS